MIFDTILKPTLDSVTTLISQFHLSPDEKLKANQAISDAAEKARTEAQQYEIQLATLAASDKISARNMQIGTKDRTPRVLAYVITIGFFSLLGFMALREVPTGSKDILNIMVGSLGAAWVSVVSFYYGSSAGSAAKDETIAKQAGK
jgi:23S rRNA maturation mini-RNase III